MMSVNSMFGDIELIEDISRTDEEELIWIAEQAITSYEQMAYIMIGIFVVITISLVFRYMKNIINPFKIKHDKQNVISIIAVQLLTIAMPLAFFSVIEDVPRYIMDFIAPTMVAGGIFATTLLMANMIVFRKELIRLAKIIVTSIVGLVSALLGLSTVIQAFTSYIAQPRFVFGLVASILLALLFCYLSKKWNMKWKDTCYICNINK